MARALGFIVRSWKLLALIASAGLALAWQLPGCTESHMAFSPNGRQLAFMVQHPFGGKGGKDVHMVGPHLYRLLVVTDQKDLRLVEETTKELLTAPAWSADGKRLAYLRIPLLANQQEAEELEKATKRKKEAWNQATSAPAVVGAVGKGASPELAMESLPPAEAITQAVSGYYTGEPIKVTLVLRDTATWEVVTTLDMWLPLGAGDSLADSFQGLYGFLQIAFTPDGNWVCFGWNNMILAAGPYERRVRLLAVGTGPRVSPDGKLLAFQSGESIGLMDLGGQWTRYWRVKAGVYGWKDEKTMLLLAPPDDSPGSAAEGKKLAFQTMSIDGKLGEKRNVPLAVAGLDSPPDFQACSPDGQLLVAAKEDVVYFFDQAGKLLGQWPPKTAPAGADEKKIFGHPAFSADGKQVAFKLVGKEQGVSDILFLSPEGVEKARVGVPEFKPTATRPAAEAATTSHPSRQ